MPRPALATPLAGADYAHLRKQERHSHATEYWRNARHEQHPGPDRRCAMSYLGGDYTAKPLGQSTDIVTSSTSAPAPEPQPEPQDQK